MKFVCFGKGAESWYDVNKADWEEFLEHFWTCRRRENRYKKLTSNLFRSKPTCLHGGFLFGAAKCRPIPDVTVFRCGHVG